MTQLVLSLFPGIGLLDRAFEEEGFVIVRGPDVLWGGDVRNFHPPAGHFDGVIGGPPCQAFSPLQRLVEHNRRKARERGETGAYPEAENLIPEFERCVSEAAPSWFLMENVPEAPLPFDGGMVGVYGVCDRLVRDVWVGGATSRLRRFSMGMKGLANLAVQARFHVEVLALHRTDTLPAVLASGGGRDRPVRIGGSGRPKRSGRIHHARDLGYKTRKAAAAAAVGQGLPEDFLEAAPFTVAGRIKVIGNGVPLAMGRAIARAVRQALGMPLVERVAVSL